MRKCIVDGEIKYFHEWTSVPCLLGIPKKVVYNIKGIIEDVKTGKVTTCAPEYIKFVDMPKDEIFQTNEEIDALVNDIQTGIIGKLHTEEQISIKCHSCGRQLYPNELYLEDGVSIICMDCNR